MAIIGNYYSSRVTFLEIDLNDSGICIVGVLHQLRESTKGVTYELTAQNLENTRVDCEWDIGVRHHVSFSRILVRAPSAATHVSTREWLRQVRLDYSSP